MHAELRAFNYHRGFCVGRPPAVALAVGVGMVRSATFSCPLLHALKRLSCAACTVNSLQQSAAQFVAKKGLGPGCVHFELGRGLALHTHIPSPVEVTGNAEWLVALTVHCILQVRQSSQYIAEICRDTRPPSSSCPDSEENYTGIVV